MLRILRFVNPIVNNDLKSNTKEQEEKVSADPNYKFEIENGSYGSYKNISDSVENIALCKSNE